VTPEAARSPENGFNEDEEVLNGAELKTDRTDPSRYSEVLSGPPG